MNTGQVEALRALLASSGWLERTGHFARALRGRSRTPHGLLVVGTPGFEPWHMTAHLEDESRLAGLPELSPTLVRWAPPHGLLVVGTPGFEPWHMTAHLEDESRLAAPAGRHRQDRGGGQIADAARCGL